jgi:hypothetical protein
MFCPTGALLSIPRRRNSLSGNEVQESGLRVTPMIFTSPRYDLGLAIKSALLGFP